MFWSSYPRSIALIRGELYIPRWNGRGDTQDPPRIVFTHSAILQWYIYLYRWNRRCIYPNGIAKCMSQNITGGTVPLECSHQGVGRTLLTCYSVVWCIICVNKLICIVNVVHDLQQNFQRFQHSHKNEHWHRKLGLRNKKGRRRVNVDGTRVSPWSVI